MIREKDENGEISIFSPGKFHQLLLSTCEATAYKQSPSGAKL